VQALSPVVFTQCFWTGWKSVIGKRAATSCFAFSGRLEKLGNVGCQCRVRFT
jgi:hypothetical protein